MNALIWHRNDLRIHDHMALCDAVAKHTTVLGLYCIDPKIWQGSQFGFRKMGYHRAKFLLEGLTDLRESYRKRGGELLVAIGSPEDIIPMVMKQVGSNTVYAHQEAMSEEVQSEQKVRSAIGPAATLELSWGHTLYHPDDLPMKIESLPDVFSSFRGKVEKYAEVRGCMDAPERIPAPAIPEALRQSPFCASIPKPENFGFEHQKHEIKPSITFIGGETEAWMRLKHYFWDTQELQRYKLTRNGLLGPDYSSKFSPWLAAGCISPKAIYDEVRRFENEIVKNDSTYWLVFELIWRDYFRFVGLKYGDLLFSKGGIRRCEPAERKNDAILEAWVNGSTGIPLVDANMRELKYTGFMSNRGRQNVSSFLVKDLRQPWRAGAAYFEEQLIDYDVTSNWGNWAYVAGVGNDPREDRYFNMLTQAERYDPKGEYVRHWLPELIEISDRWVHTPWLADSAGAKTIRPVMIPKTWKL